MNEPKLEIVEVPDDMKETPFVSFYTQHGDLLVKNTDPGEDFGELGIMGFIPVEAIPALRKHLNEGMVERWIINFAGPEFQHYTNKKDAEDEADTLYNERSLVVRIFVPAEPVDGSET